MNAFLAKQRKAEREKEKESENRVKRWGVLCETTTGEPSPFKVDKKTKLTKAFPTHRYGRIFLIKKWRLHLVKN